MGFNVFYGTSQTDKDKTLDQTTCFYVIKASTTIKDILQQNGKRNKLSRREKERRPLTDGLESELELACGC